MDDPHVEPGAVRVEGDIRLQDVASAHLDEADAEDDVRAAVAVVLEADLGSDDAQFVVDQAEGHELAWYATQEIGPCSTSSEPLTLPGVDGGPPAPARRPRR